VSKSPPKPGNPFYSALGVILIAVMLYFASKGCSSK
jgi:hypothetical protein